CHSGEMAQRPPRLFIAAEILSGTVRLDGYPFRTICVGQPSRSAAKGFFTDRADLNAVLDQVFSAVELLECQGWRVIGFEQNGAVAFLQRREHARDGAAVSAERG
ncbi:MAG: hypothetical protein JXA67_15685, partial [Micromonosporaceae bacterium]|nr:hypothetical protein [Micromonosporaceae bacterium]